MVAATVLNKLWWTSDGVLGIQIEVFRVVTPCNAVVRYQRFRIDL